MYEVQIISRGDEGEISRITERVTKAGSDELQKRIEKAKASGDRRFTDILLNIELEPLEEKAPEGQQVRGKRNTKS